MKNKLKTQKHIKYASDITRRDFLSTSMKVGAAAFTTGLFPHLNASSEGKYNVLFMIVDDLRPMLGCYGIPEMHTPNIDELANNGTLFNRAYCQYPLCNPSRASILTGLRPETTGIHNNSTDYTETLTDVVDIFQHYSEQGYETYEVGKVRHYAAPFSGGTSWKALNVSDDELSDGQTAKQTEELLANIKDQSFFLTVGFDKPHLPFYAPKSYYSLYRRDDFSLPASLNYPENSPKPSYNKIDLFRLYQDIPNGNEPISEEQTIELIRAYAASTSYMDAQVGRVLRKLDTLGLTEKTVVVFCGDHGFHLGEHGTWRKNTLFEIGVRSPLLIKVPGQQPCQTNGLAELVDIYPTLCDACEIPVPSQLEGFSLVPLIEEPTRPVKTAAFSFLKRGGVNGNSIRTDRYRYTEWGIEGRNGHELYDYIVDPDETMNVADLPENTELVDDLRQKLRAGWEHAIPTGQEYIEIPLTVPWDINNDGIVDMQDMLLVSNSFGEEEPENPKVDVNKDGTIDMIDLLYVASHLGETCYASSPNKVVTNSLIHIDTITNWITEAYQSDDGSDVYKNGIANLEALVNVMTPNQTVLHQNYPNPFNPETWIPYDLGQDGTVDINIYNLKGETVRKIRIGYQIAGTYRTKDRAAYWDGRNTDGEPVSSGVYYYSLNTRNSKAIRRMLILK